MKKNMQAIGLLVGVGLALIASAGYSRDFVVTSNGDQGDGNPGNGFCATSGMFATCTLRAAVEEANAFPGVDRILIGTGTIQLGFPELVISDHVTIEGNGAYQTVLLGNADYPTQIFHVEDLVLAVIRDVTLRGGRGGTVASGGAIRNAGILSINRVWFDANSGHGCGAVWSLGTTDIFDSTFSGNHASPNESGGALCVTHGGRTTVTNSTFVGNSAANGGAIYVTNANSELEVYSSTFIDNRDNYPQSVPTSSAIYLGSGSLHLDKTLIAGTCQYFGNPVTSNGGNMESPGNTCLLGATADIANVTREQLHLGTFGDYGGPVPTVLPGTESWAVDPGLSTVTCPEFDARGEPRVSFCDVGAVERQPSEPESGPMFYDGLETGDTQGWSVTSP